MLIARFVGNVDELTEAYYRAHTLITSRGEAVPIGELRHRPDRAEEPKASVDQVAVGWTLDDDRKCGRAAACFCSLFS